MVTDSKLAWQRPPNSDRHLEIWWKFEDVEDWWMPEESATANLSGCNILCAGVIELEIKQVEVRFKSSKEDDSDVRIEEECGRC